jgi:hypothetical protein
VVKILLFIIVIAAGGIVRAAESAKPQAAAAPAAAAAATQRPQSYDDRYAVLTKQNIFLRDRSERPPSRHNSTTEPAPRPPEEAFILRGVVIEDDGIRAYIEDARADKLLRLAPGDAVARGRITDVQIDGIDYELTAGGGHPQFVAIGQDLSGQTVAAASGSSSSSASSSSSSTQSSSGSSSSNGINPNDPSLSVEQQMRLRRQQGK